MSVNEIWSGHQHILTWVNMERQARQDEGHAYTIEQIFQTEFIKETLHDLDESYFPISLGSQPEEILIQIEIYLDKQFGKRLKYSTRKELANYPLSESFLKILIYLCVSSKKNDEYINRIMGLSEQAQNKLMEDIQTTNDSVENILQLQEIIKEMDVLEEENEELKVQLKKLRDNQVKHLRLLNDWEEQAKKLTSQLEKYKKQKEKVCQVLRIMDLNDYTDVFRKVQEENKYLASSLEQYEQKNNFLTDSYQDLQNQLKENSSIISQLNEQITKIKDLYHGLKMEKSCFQDTLDATRCFGKVLDQNSGQENSKIQGHGINRRYKHDYHDQLQNYQQILPPSLVQVSDQLQQIRKYNRQIIQKLEQAYKSINSMSKEVSLTKQKNNKLKKHVKFYQNQIKDLKKNLSRFERYFLQDVL